MRQSWRLSTRRVSRSLEAADCRRAERRWGEADLTGDGSPLLRDADRSRRRDVLEVACSAGSGSEVRRLESVGMGENWAARPRTYSSTRAMSPSYKRLLSGASPGSGAKSDGGAGLVVGGEDEAEARGGAAGAGGGADGRAGGEGAFCNSGTGAVVGHWGGRWRRGELRLAVDGVCGLQREGVLPSIRERGVAAVEEGGVRWCRAEVSAERRGGESRRRGGDRERERAGSWRGRSRRLSRRWDGKISQSSGG